MATKKKDFTSSDGAIDKFFSLHNSNDTNNAQHTQHTQDANNTQYTQDANNTQYTQHANSIKQFMERGKREERFGLLLDKQLKEDLFYLSKATGSKSINDFIIKILLEHIELSENQLKLEKYKKLLEYH